MRLIDADWVQVELGCAPYYKCNSGTMRQFGNGINKPVTFSERETLLKWKDILAVLDEAPTIEAEPVRHGRWVHDDLGHTYCSECHERIHYIHCYIDEPDFDWDEEWDEEMPESAYCSHCGAKMDAKEEAK